MLLERRHCVDVLALELQPLAAGHEDGRAVDCAERRELLGEPGQQVLGIVEQEQGPPAGERRPERVLQ